VKRTHEELVERILHAGLGLLRLRRPETSLVICNEPKPEQGKGYQAIELGVPLVSDSEFMDHLDSVIGGNRHRGVHRPHPRRRAVRPLLDAVTAGQACPATVPA
jgi:hypothetical protein